MEFLLIMVIITMLPKCFTCIFFSFNFYSRPVIDVLTLLHFIGKKTGAEAVKGVKLLAKDSTERKWKLPVINLD